MPVPYVAAPRTAVTPPAVDVSRYRLKQLAHWIRDDLDILVAREGPDILRPDDVLTLHELFVALRQSTSITALDLRATGIHKAVKDIAGIATRWPRRLCDDCDKIITIWTSKFGRFDELHPFLRSSKDGPNYCPEKIHPSASHRRGDLGFKAGDWWINSLFAHHAGIIGLESVDGGTTYNKNGAYALLLRDTGEIDARSEETFSYRCPISDKGKFRLTAATPTSREPIRVLRSHSINSIWGPKAGVRYEGLYSVRGWCVRQAKPTGTMGGDWKERDILYEVTLERKDPVPMEQVTCRPTNTEIDDYAEYKRLRRKYREQKHKDHGPVAIRQQGLNVGLPLPPLQLPASSTIAPQSLLCVSPSVSRQTTFKKSAFDAPGAEADRPSASDVISPMTVPMLQESFFAPKKTETLAIPAPKDMSRPGSPTSSETASHEKHAPVQSPASVSFPSVKPSHCELKEIIPWIDLEAEMPSLPALNMLPTVREQKRSQAKERLEVEASEMNPVKTVTRLARDSRRPSDLSLQSQNIRDKNTATNSLNLRLYSAKPILPILDGKKGKQGNKDEDKTRRTFSKKARFFDGAGYSADDEDDDYQVVSLKSRSSRTNSADDLPILCSQRPIRPPRPISRFECGIESIEFTSPLDDIVP
ncbi:hypothetical protein E8E12_006025 [Didymella heteroderae]|uniref:YDG domain-containing protein n=1 Tax=Didymella heteroderae TaxID=1769908 RepID=A0A9P4WRJ3_9PLEO|nr:hypothetical protein E8E12_006025 [Didymella heteroderae]